MEQFDFPAAETKDVISTFLNQSCVLLRNFVDAAALDRAYDMTLKAYGRSGADREIHLLPAENEGTAPRSRSGSDCPDALKTRENMELRFWSAASLQGSCANMTSCANMASCGTTAFEKCRVEVATRRKGLTLGVTALPQSRKRTWPGCDPGHAFEGKAAAAIVPQRLF